MISLNRNSSYAVFPTNVVVRRKDYSEPDLVEALQGQHAIECAVGAAGFGQQKTIIDTTIKAGV